MTPKRLLKSANSKGQLVKAVIAYQQALRYYALESNWAVKEDNICWVGDDDPTLPAQTVLGMRQKGKNNRPVPGQKTQEVK